MIRIISLTSLFGLLFSCFSGCSGPETSSTEQATDDSQQTQLTEAEKCRSRLTSGIRRMQPESFAQLSRREQAASGLNAWLASCGGEQLMAMQVSDQTLGLLSDSLHPMITAPRFSISDTPYIRDCIAMKRLADSLSERRGSGETEAKRIATAFDWVVRNVNLMAEDEQRVPLEMFDVLMTGRGTAEDRAWIMAEILRQREIDAVIIQPADVSDPEINSEQSLIETASWLLAVVLGEQVYLFDPATGTAVAQTNDQDVVSPAPAGLDLLKESDRWKQMTILVVAQPMAFAKRMFVLQEHLSADDSAVFYEELAGGTTEIRPLIERVRSAGGALFENASVELWQYPEQQTAAAASRAEDQELQYDRLMKPFDAPFERRGSAGCPGPGRLQPYA